MGNPNYCFMIIAVTFFSPANRRGELWSIFIFDFQIFISNVIRKLDFQNFYPKICILFFEHFSHFPCNVVQVAPVYQRSAIVPHNSCAFKDPILMANLHSSTMPFYVLWARWRQRTVSPPPPSWSLGTHSNFVSLHKPQKEPVLRLWEFYRGKIIL